MTKGNVFAQINHNY